MIVEPFIIKEKSKQIHCDTIFEYIDLNLALELAETQLGSYYLHGTPDLKTMKCFWQFFRTFLVCFWRLLNLITCLLKGGYLHYDQFYNLTVMRVGNNNLFVIYISIVIYCKNCDGKMCAESRIKVS